jgi:polyisoprenoid-binding protein YceI
MSTVLAKESIIPTGTWAADPVHSQVGFAVDYLGGTFRGSFFPVEATLVAAEDGVVELSGTAPVAGIKVQEEEHLKPHLLSPDFFDVEQAPTIEFKGSSIERFGDEVRVEGELQIKGFTQPVELSGTVGIPIVDSYGKERVGLTLATTVERSQFGLNWNLELPSGEPALGNDVTVTAELYLVRQ